MPELTPKQIASKQLHALDHLRKQFTWALARVDDLEKAIREGRPPRTGGQFTLALEVERVIGRHRAARGETPRPASETRAADGAEDRD